MPMLTALAVSVPSGLPVASHRPAGNAVPAAPGTTTSGAPSLLTSPSLAGGVIVVPSNQTVVDEPRLPPADRAVTVSVLTSRVRGTEIAVAPVWVLVTAGAWSTW